MLKYLKGAPGKGIVFQPSKKLEVLGISDADWNGDHLQKSSLYQVFVLLLVGS
jgi:hypothetical protein